MPVQAQLKTKLTADITSFERGLRKATAGATAFGRNITSRLGSALTSPLAALSAAIAGAASFGTLVSGVEGMIESGTELKKLSRTTGVSVQSLAALKPAFKQADLGAEEMGLQIGHMERTLFQATKSGHSGQAIFRELGLNFQELARLSPELQFQEIGVAINRIQNPVAKAGVAMQIFGRSGRELLPVFEEIADVDFAKLSPKAKLLSDNADLFFQVTQAFRKASANLRNVFLGVAVQVAPFLLKFEKFVGGIDALGIGVKLGKAFADAAKILFGIFKDPGALWDVFSNYGKSAVASVMNTMAVDAIKTGVVLTQGFGLAGDILGNFGSLLSGGFKIATGDLIDGLGKGISYFDAGIIWAFENALEFFDGGWRGALEGFKTALYNSFTYAIDGLKIGLHAIWDEAKSFWKTIVDAIALLPGIADDTANAMINAFAGHNEEPKATPGEQKPESKPFKARTFADILATQPGGETISAFGSNLKASGDQSLADGAAGLKNVGKAIEDFKNGTTAIWNAKITKDFFGAAEYKKRALAALDKLKFEGEKAIDALIGGSVGRIQRDPWARFKNFTSIMGGMNGSLSTGSLATANATFSSGGLNQSAYGQTNLLTAAERRHFTDIEVASGKERQGSTGAAFGAIRSGDHRRHREYMRNALKQEQGVDKTNTLLSEMNNTMSQAWQ